PEEEVRPLLGDLAIAAVNAPGSCVVAGPAAAVEGLRARLEERGVDSRRLHTSHAFHSPMMEPAVAPFRDIVAGVSLSAPRIPYVSNVTGTWITAGVAELLREPDRVLLEAGPGRTLSTLAGRHPERSAGHAVVSSLRQPRD